MRQPVLAPSGGILNTIIYIFLLRKEAVAVTINKMPSRIRIVQVDKTDMHTWKEFIMTEIN